jgi:hypothetical protein
VVSAGALIFETGLVVGWIGGVLIPGRRVLPVILAVLVGLASAAAGGAVAIGVFGYAYPVLRCAVCAAVTLLCVGGFTLHERERRLPH